MRDAEAIRGETECDPTDEVAEHHDWTNEPLAVCRRCGVLSREWRGDPFPDTEEPPPSGQS